MGLTKVTSSILDDVTAFGAVGNGIADDRAAIQAAIDATANGSVMRLGVGKTYYIGSRLIVDHAMTIDATGATIQFANNRAAGGYSNDAMTITSSNVHLVGGTWKEVYPASYGLGYPGIVFLGTENVSAAPTYITNVSVNNAVFENWESDAVTFAFVSGFKFNENTVTNCGHGGCLAISANNGCISNNTIGLINPTGTTGDNSYPIAVTLNNNGNTTQRPLSHSITVANNLIYDCFTWEGIDTHGGYNITISGNTLKNCRTGIAAVSYLGASGATDAGPINVTISNNTLYNDLTAFPSGRDSLGRGIVVEGRGSGASVLGQNCTVIGNSLYYCGGKDANESTGAIECQGINNLTVSGNSIEYAGSSGIAVYTCNNMTIQGNNIFSLDPYNSTTFPSATFTFSGNPSAADTITLNGVVCTFVAGASAINSNTAIDVNIAGTLADTLTGLQTILTTAATTGTATVMPNGRLSYLNFNVDSTTFTPTYKYPTRMLRTSYSVAKSSAAITLSGANLSVPSADQGSAIVVDILSGGSPCTGMVISNNIRNPDSSGITIRGICQKADCIDVVYKNNSFSGKGVLYDIVGSSILTCASIDKFWENSITNINLPSISANASFEMFLPYPSQQVGSLGISDIRFDRYSNGLTWTVQPAVGYGILQIFNATSGAIDLATTRISYSVVYGTDNNRAGFGLPT